MSWVCKKVAETTEECWEDSAVNYQFSQWLLQASVWTCSWVSAKSISNYICPTATGGKPELLVRWFEFCLCMENYLVLSFPRGPSLVECYKRQSSPSVSLRAVSDPQHTNSLHPFGGIMMGLKMPGNYLSGQYPLYHLIPNFIVNFC